MVDGVSKKGGMEGQRKTKSERIGSISKNARKAR